MLRWTISLVGAHKKPGGSGYRALSQQRAKEHACGGKKPKKRKKKMGNNALVALFPSFLWNIL